METHILLTGLSYFALAVMIYVIIRWMIAETKKERKKKQGDYDDLYFKLQKIIRDYQVTEENYYWIIRLLDRLKKMKYKNPQKTEVLQNEFYKKYKEISDAILEEEDYAFESNRK